MSEQSQSYNTSPSPEQVEELLRGDYTKGDREGDRAGGEKVEAVRDELAYRKSLMATVNTIVDGFCSGVFTLDYTLDLLSSALQQFDVHPDTVQSDGSSEKVMEHPVKELEASAHDLNKDFLTLVIPKDWADQSIIVSLFDDGWEVCRAKDHPLGDFSKPGWTDDMTIELTELRRIKNELAGSLQKIYIYADQIENNNQALLENSFDDEEQRGVEIMDRYLAAQIKVYIRRHLKINLEVTSYDILY